MKGIYTGSRDWVKEDVVHRTLWYLLYLSARAGQKLEVIHGDARGLDRIVKHWVRAVGYWGLGGDVTDHPYPVTADQWRDLGPAAGPTRNERMCRENYDAAVCVSFATSVHSKGTMNCLGHARALNIPTWEHYLGRPAPFPPRLAV